MSDPIVFIPLTQGKVAVVDFSDFELVRPFKWYLVRNWNRKTCYASTSVKKRVGKWSHKKMHNVITGWARVDHRNGNGLDNRRCNLRPFNQGQNLRSFFSPRTQSSSKYRGVTWWRPGPHKWKAQIMFNYKNRHLGYFDSEEDAARAYDSAAKRFGYSDEALNFPPTRDPDFKIL